METFGKRLKRLRQKRGLGVRELAEELGIPPTTYREWEYGRRIREPGSYVELARALRVSLFELMTGEAPGSASIEKDLAEIQTRVTRIQMKLVSLKRDDTQFVV